MGRTVMPYSLQIDRVLERLNRFRRGLRRDDQAVFDQLIRIARTQVQAGVMAANPDPFHSMLLSMLVEMQAQLNRQQEEIRRLCAVLGTEQEKGTTDEQDAG